MKNQSAAVLFFLSLGGCASVQNASIPSNLVPDSSEKLLMTHFARGVQLYKCELQAGKPAWRFVAPRAELFASHKSDVSVGTHGAGPFWQGNDASRVVGTVKSRADAPTPTAIPWLLLTTKNESGRPGAMAAITNIQRINTQGGVAPTTGCANEADLGKEIGVPYTTDYVYFTKG